MRKFIFILTALIILSLILGYTAVVRADPPPACGVVTTNTVLKGDCTGPLTVAASNIHINLGGHTITCGGNPDVVGIELPDQTKVHLSNGTVTGCGTGIRLSGGGSHHLNRLNIVHNLCCGADLIGDGIRLIESHDNNLNGVNASFSDAVGVRVENSDRNKLNGMVVNSNRVRPVESAGIIFTHSQDNVVNGSEILENGDFGILIQGGSSEIIIRNNKVNNTNVPGIPTAGILVSESTEITLQGNTANGNGWGIHLSSGTRESRIQNNTTSDNSNHGILVQAGATENKLQNNTALNNGLSDLVDENSNCDANLWQRNNFNTDSEGNGPGEGCIR